jgi:hypothetical protein
MMYFLTHNPNGSEAMYPHMIILEFADSKNLIKHQKLAVFRDDVLEWLNELEGGWYWNHGGAISFKQETDAVAFKLKWL